jgi:hypothetical protein
MRFLKGAAILAVALSLAMPAQAADNFSFKDAGGTTRTARAKEVSTGVYATTHTVANSGGTLIDPATSTLQSSLNGLIGEVQASPTSNTVLDRLKVINTTLGAGLNVVCTSGCSAGGGLAQGSTTSGQSGALNMGAVTTSAPSYTNAQTSPLSLTTAGALRVADSAAAALLATIDASLNDIEAAAEDTSAASVNLSAPTSGGCTIGATQSAASTNATSVKGSAGLLCGGTVINTTATLYYLRLYNLASAPTCSSATGFVATIPVPASTSGAGTVINLGTYGATFATGIGFCLTGGGSSTDNTSAATGVYVTLAYT